MNTENPKHDSPGQAHSKASRKPYQKPAFRLERVFEVMALACGKVGTTQSACRANRRNS
jgi:hypothetical protein